MSGISKRERDESICVICNQPLPDNLKDFTFATTEGRKPGHPMCIENLIRRSVNLLRVDDLPAEQ